MDEITTEVTKLEFVDLPAEQFQLKAFNVEEPAAPITPGQPAATDEGKAASQPSKN